MHRAAIERSRAIFNQAGSSHLKDSYNESLHVWRLADGRLIEFASMKEEAAKEKQRGRDRDLYTFDELPQFTESMYRFTISWLRSDAIDPFTGGPQRCRIVNTGNPPTCAEGEWVIRYWAPWLDRHHPHPAKPGELRWFARIDDRDVEVESGALIRHKREMIRPRSRTFIPARVWDNPVMLERGYMAALQALPEPLRSQALYGDFSIGVQDNAWQCIPTAWVRAAQARWKPGAPGPLSCLGVDVAHGGADATVIVPRHGTWFGQPKKYQGPITDSGDKAAVLVLREHDGKAPINVDAIGYGAACCESLQRWRQPGSGICLIVNALNVGTASAEVDRSGMFRLVNNRAAGWWKLREALDPEHGQGLALPPDPEVLADLTAPRYKLTTQGILVEPKVDIIARLGRSPDVGDAIVNAHWPQTLVLGPPVVDPDNRTTMSRAPGGLFYEPGKEEEW